MARHGPPPPAENHASQLGQVSVRGPSRQRHRGGVRQRAKPPSPQGFRRDLVPVPLRASKRRVFVNHERGLGGSGSRAVCVAAEYSEQPREGSRNKRERESRIPSVARIGGCEKTGGVKEKMLELCACTMVWNQARPMREWVMYHT
ncbi:hypothetical protein LR48_Vigan01g271400 [Vigna angularis]|uniref:Uncharacterized protein n=1 Tax=Phaseolus angularis TaxID=3914 RepID=A0A0L9TRE6_PHAAN|nr:hypothetical protein LR48_Vigan01g271400 [Vigna angularis]